MKIRTGFVSNSSSTSFTCCICDEEQSGMDLGLSEAGMVECQNGHTFCEDHKLNKKALTTKDYREWFKKYAEGDEELLVELERKDRDFKEWFEEEYLYEMEDEGIPSNQCPICQFKISYDSDIANYFLKLNNLTIKKFAESMKEKFGTYEEFKKYISNKKGK